MEEMEESIAENQEQLRYKNENKITILFYVTIYLGQKTSCKT